MTKRFKVKGTKIYDNKEPLIIDESKNLLNKFYEENMELKSKIENLRCYNAELKKDNNDLMEEHAKAMNELDWLKEAIDTTESVFALNYSKANDLLERRESKIGLDVIREIWKQYELIQLREESL